MAASSNRTGRRFVVRGRVQGVGFRYFTEKAAGLTGVTGWVRNLDDGTVEAVACGTPEELDAFAGYLHRGPRWSEVRAVEVAEHAVVATRGFAIKH